MTVLIILVSILIIEVSYLVYKSAPRIGKLKQAIFIDTSSLMDGRIVTAAQTGFIPHTIVVPRSVINELQLLADQADPEKRTRARRGLDAVTELKEMTHLNVKTIDDGRVGAGGVDERLIDLAKSHGGSICTIDFNLNKAATALGIRVLNINELAGNIRMAFLPGETISLALTQKGQNNSQAVGYLTDGTMVVVDKASAVLGQTVEIEFIRSLQTAAGRMMFAKLISDPKTTDAASRTEPKASGRRSVKKPAGQNERTEKSSDSPSADKNDSRSLAKSRSGSQGRRRSGEDSLIELVNKQ